MGLTSGRPVLELKVTGLQDLERRLQSLGQDIADQAGNALRAEGEIEMTEAKRRTPVKTGALKGSGHVTGPRWRGRDVSVTLAFGGPAAPYVIPVHENLQALHPVGQAKFLESVLNESAPFMADRIARRIKV